MANATVGINFIIKEGPNGLKTLVMDADGLRKAMQSTLKVTNDLQTKFVNFASFATGVKNATDSLNQLSSTLNALTQDYSSFSGAMKAANTMAGKGSEDFEKLKGDVADLAKEIPIARDLLAKGLYQTISNGVPEDNWLTFLRDSARSSVGGIADLEKVVGVTATVIKNYGLEWEEAGAIQDKIQLTAKNGVTSFEQLAASLPRVTGNAATLGVSIDELMASFATLTGVSGNTAEVSTQLAAIFSALVKPSSEATKMASEMGIQFDAAAIKAAGGFDTFLKSLDQSVKEYSQASGTLEQEVYGKLFGSAESLRALVPLQGELSSKFTENVANMVDSAGTMDAAFKDMASTGEATAQQLKNRFANLTDKISGVLANVTPYANFTSAVLTSASSVIILQQGLSKLNVIQKAHLYTQKALTAVQKVYNWFTNAAITRNRLLTVSYNGVAVGATAASNAIRGLMICTAVGAAISGLITVLMRFSKKTKEAAEEIEQLKEASEEYVRAGADAKSQIEGDTKALGELIKTGRDCTEMVKTLNERYGELFGTHQKESEWMDILTRKSQIYVKAKAYEAQVIALRQKAAEQALKKEVAAEKMARLEKEGKDRTTSSRPVITGRTVRARVVTVESEEYSKLKKERDEAERLEKSITSELEVVEKKSADVHDELESNIRQTNKGVEDTNKKLKASAMSMDQVTTALDRNKTARQKLKGTEPDYEKQRKALLDEKHQLEARKKVLEKTLELETKHSSGKTGQKRAIVADPSTKKELQTNISMTREKLSGKDTEEERRLLRNIRLWEDQLDVIKMTEAAYSRPASLDTLERIDEELQYQRTLRQKSRSEFIAGIDDEIRSLEDMRRAMEDVAFVPVPVDEIKTYEELERQLSHYREIVRRTSGEEQSAAQKMVNSLEEVSKAWDILLSELKEPADISLLDTSEKIDEALSYYRERQNRASASERAEIQETINALTKKNEVLNRGVDLVNLRRDADEIEKLTGKDYKIKVKAMDIDTLAGQIRDLQRLLADTENPVTDEQRESIEALIAVYSKWRKEAYDTAGAVATAWGEVKNLKGAVSSITSALDENASAWERISGLIDGFVQAFQGIRSVVELISRLTEVTQGLALAKSTETAAEQSDTAATAANTAATAVNTAVAEANTAAKSGEAVAEATASGASLPFPANIAAIAAGLASVMSALAVVGSFATGGIVGGSSPSGDRLLARVNSGEMILNMSQQKRLFNFLNGSGSIRGVSAPELTRVTPRPADLTPHLRTQASGGTVVFRIDGRTLVGVLANETRIAGKSGRRTEIKI